MQAARIPCDAASITEMIKLMDANQDGCISWDEFEAFMMHEFAAGQQLLSGEFVLPSGEEAGLVYTPAPARHSTAQRVQSSSPRAAPTKQPHSCLSQFPWSLADAILCRPAFLSMA